VDLAVSAIIPVHNAGADLPRCLEALRRSSLPPAECIVVDDGSTDDSAAIAHAAGALVLATGRRKGPAHARNLGAKAASGDLLFFLDADVAVREDTIQRLAAHFQENPPADAAIGSYDDDPPGGGVISQYKNLQHHYVHQCGSEEANTFWTGCGMIRREVFFQAGGFDERFSAPSIEDIELGYRLRAAGRRIVLEKRAMVKHYKRWTLASWLHTDIFLRGVPWMELTLRHRRLPNDLNVSTGQRASVALVWGSLPALAASAITGIPAPAFAGLLALGAVLAINAPFYRFLAARRGAPFAALATALHLLYFAYCGLAVGLGVLRFLWRRRRLETPSQP